MKYFGRALATAGVALTIGGCSALPPEPLTHYSRATSAIVFTQAAYNDEGGYEYWGPNDEAIAYWPDALTSMHKQVPTLTAQLVDHCRTRGGIKHGPAKPKTYLQQNHSNYSACISRDGEPLFFWYDKSVDYWDDTRQHTRVVVERNPEVSPELFMEYLHKRGFQMKRS